MSRRFFALLMLASVLLFAVSVFAEDAWMNDFEDICGRTNEASTMSKDELKSLIAKCDSVKAQIEKSDNPQKNVYLFRLDKCKKLFMFVLEVEEGK